MDEFLNFIDELRERMTLGKGLTIIGACLVFWVFLILAFSL